MIVHYHINGINSSRGADQLILYNHFYGTSTGTNNFGTEISIEAIDSWLVNDTVRCIVMNKENGIGDMNLSIPQQFLSGHGISKAYLDSIIKCWMIQLELLITYPYHFPRLRK